MAIEEIRNFRLQKLKKLQEAGMDPFTGKTKRDFSIGEVLEKWSNFENNEKISHVVGRVMALRGQGALIFVDIDDGTGKIQSLLKKGDIEDSLLTLFEETIDLGDFIEVSGTFFVTKRGEKTIAVKDWRILTKSLHPLPEKWHGLQDVEERYRKRYLDILLNPELKKIIELKAKFWLHTREFLNKKGFIEVETPTFEITTGGAEANPFMTHHDDFDIDVYMRISVGELWQKRLLAAGLSKTYEIGRVYRNEGTSPEHVQEFTNCEFYSSYCNFEEGVAFTEELVKEVVSRTFGKMNFETRGFKINLEGNWPRLNYVETVKEKTGLDVMKASEKELKEKLKELKVDYEDKNRERLVDSLWKYCRRQITGPAWLIGHPKFISPLAKAVDGNGELVERAQLILAGAEVGNGYEELNNPIEQKERFEEQQKLLKGGDKVAMMPDFEFVEMLEHGMPPAFGMGFGERLFSFLVDKPIRETQIFPLMRPKKESK